MLIFKIRGLNGDALFYAFKRFIAYFIFILEAAGDLKSDEDIARNFYENFPSLAFDSGVYNESHRRFQHLINLIEDDRISLGVFQSEDDKKMINFINEFPNEIGVEEFESKIQVYANDFALKTIQWSERHNKYIIVANEFYMRIKIEVDSETVSTSKLLEPLYLITSALENIKGNTVNLESIEKGSLTGDIKVIMKDLVAKEETKTVLEVGKEIAVAALTAGTVSYSEVIKNRKESKNADLEHEKLVRELEQMPSDTEVQYDRALDTERKNLENDKLRLDNIKAQLEIIESLSGLVAKGVLSADMLKISINGALVLLKEKGQIKEIGPDISDII